MIWITTIIIIGIFIKIFKL